jgi:hypothetical protein
MRSVKSLEAEKDMDAPEREIRRNVLLRLIAELYDMNLSDVIAVKEWLQSKLDEPAEGEPRCTNHYLCPNDSTRWNAGWSCVCNDRCATCAAVVEPYATTDNADHHETIHNQVVYDRANAVGQ